MPELFLPCLDLKHFSLKADIIVSTFLHSIFIIKYFHFLLILSDLSEGEFVSFWVPQKMSNAGKLEDENINVFEVCEAACGGKNPS